MFQVRVFGNCARLMFFHSTQNQDKIHWASFSANPNAIELFTNNNIIADDFLKLVVVLFFRMRYWAFNNYVFVTWGILPREDSKGRAYSNA